MRKLFFILLLAAASCNREPAENAVSTHSPYVRLSVSTPEASIPRRATRAGADPECDISAVRVLVFKPDEGEYLFRYMTDGLRVSNDGLSATFDALLHESADSVKLLVVANYGDAFGSYTPQAGEAECDVRKNIALCIDGNLACDLPMCGEIALKELKADGTDNISVTMLRAVARVDMIRDLDPVSDSFRLIGVTVYGANDKIQIAPDPAARQALPPAPVTAPSVPAGCSRLDFCCDHEGAPLASVEKLYVPESQGTDNAAEQLTGVTRIVVAGYYGDDEELSYYRVDFDPGIEGHPFGQVLRNHKYVVRIKRVFSRGWESADEAANNKANSMLAEIGTWDNLVSEMFFGTQEGYLGISSRQALLRYRAGYEKTLYIQSSVTYGVQRLDAAGNPSGKVITAAGDTLQTTFCNIALVKNPGDPGDIRRLVVTSKNKNTGAASYTAKLRISYGTWQFDVEIVQETFAKYSNRTINILTGAGEIGHLGTSVGTAAYYSQLRNVLDNTANFSPSGTVTIKGFAYNQIYRGAPGLMSTSAADLTGIEKFLATYHIIFLSYNCNPSTQVASLLAQWVQADRHRVLVIGTDYVGTNDNLKYLAYADGIPTFTYYAPYTIADALTRPADNTPENAPFLNGIFGYVSPSTTYTKYDDTLGFAAYTSATTGVTPIVVLCKSNVAGTNVAVGVNQSKRTVYFGDASLIGSPMSNTGLADTDLNRLMANLWAWMAEQVVWED